VSDSQSPPYSHPPPTPIDNKPSVLILESSGKCGWYGSQTYESTYIKKEFTLEIFNECKEDIQKTFNEKCGRLPSRISLINHFKLDKK
jgi:hypothetical protein